MGIRYLPAVAAGGVRDFFAAVRGIVKNLSDSLGIAIGGTTLWVATSAAFGGVFVIDKTLPAPTSATQLIYSPDNHALVLKNTASTIAVVDVTTGAFSLRSANTRFNDITLSPSRRYVFAAVTAARTSVRFTRRPGSTRSATARTTTRTPATCSDCCHSARPCTR